MKCFNIFTPKTLLLLFLAVWAACGSEPKQLSQSESIDEQLESPREDGLMVGKEGAEIAAPDSLEAEKAIAKVVREYMKALEDGDLEAILRCLDSYPDVKPPIREYFALITSR